MNDKKEQKPSCDTSDTPNTSPFKSLSDIISEKPPLWTIHGILPKHGYGVMYGRESCGKTFLVFELLFSIATERSIFEHQPNPGLTVHVSGEGNFGLGNRARAWMKSNGVENPDSVPIRFYTIAFNLLDEDEVKTFIHRLRREIGDYPIACICLDTLNRAMAGEGDENSTRDTNRATTACERIARELNCFVFVVHHQPKSSNDDDPTPRGSNVIPANADTVLHVRKHDLGLLVHLQKQKDASDGRSFLFRMEHVDLEITDAEGYPQTSCVARYDGEMNVENLSKTPSLSSNQQAILDLLRNTSAESGIHFDELYKAALSNNIIKGEKPKRAFTNAVKGLVTHKLIASNENEVYRPVIAESSA